MELGARGVCQSNAIRGGGRTAGGDSPRSPCSGTTNFQPETSNFKLCASCVSLALPMTFLPIVGRELRVAARRRGTYWTRVAFAMLAIVILGLILLGGDNSTSADLARAVFMSNSVLAFIYCGLSGMFSTADCVSEEKREGTLGLLFLTDLKAYDVVFGKLAATSIHSLYGLIAIFPVLAIPLLLGGVLNSQVWRMSAVLLNTLFFSLATGVLVSTLSRNDRKAAAATFGVVAFITLILPLVGRIIELYVFDSRQEAPLAFFLPSPMWTLFLEFKTWDPPFKVVKFFWPSLLTTHLTAWLFLAVSCRALPRIWQDKPLTARSLLWRERWQLWCYGDGTERQRFRTRLLGVNPFFWLAGRNRLSPMLVWLVLGVCAATWLFGYVKLGHDLLEDPVLIAVAVLLHFILKIWVASEACRQLASDRQSGALELLLSTPLATEEIMRGQILALRRQFGGPLLAVLFVDALFMVGKWPPGEDGRRWALAWMAWMATLVADVWALGMLSMWLSLTARRASRAVRGAMFRIVFLPVLITIGTGIFFTIAKRASGPTVVEDYIGYFWFMLGFALDAIFGLQARSQLLNDLRNYAIHRFDQQRAARGWWPFAKTAPAMTPTPEEA